MAGAGFGPQFLDLGFDDLALLGGWIDVELGLEVLEALPQPPPAIDHACHARELTSPLVGCVTRRTGLW
jgi:hypothetical protein